MTLIHIKPSEYGCADKIIDLVRLLVEYDDKEEAEAFTKAMADIKQALVDFDIEESR